MRALSNTERQNRYRQRLKARAERAASGADNILQELLSGEYFAAGVEMLHRHAGDDLTQASIAEFQSGSPITPDKMCLIMQEAGQKMAADIFQRRATAYLAMLSRPELPAR
jgi:hypothetical protein